MENKREKAVKNKIIYFVALLFMCMGLFFMAYFFFLRTIEIDVTKDIDLTYIGEEGKAKVEAKCCAVDINQRMQKFYDSIEYTITPDKNLSNGDTIIVKATYDSLLAQQYHYKPIHEEKKIVVKGLPHRYEGLIKIPDEYLERIQKTSDAYIQKEKDKIFETEFDFNKKDRVKLVQQQVVYSAFMHSTSNEKTDRVVTMYHLEFEWDGKGYSLYYVVCVPEINDNQEINEKDIYGQRAYLVEGEDYDEYIHRIYESHYRIESSLKPEEDSSLPVKKEENQKKQKEEK